jgi:dihydroorotase
MNPILNSLTLVQVRRIDPATGEDAIGDFSVAAGVVVPAQSAARALHAAGLVLLPGLIDVHVHFRDPGIPAAEDLFTGAQAAARGGFTRVVTMPNTSPACDTPAAVRRQIEADTAVRILPAACISAARAGRAVADLAALAAAGAVAFTDDGSMVADDTVMRQAMRIARTLNRPVMDHAMDPRLMGHGIIRESPLAARLGLPVIDPETEVAAVRRDIALARETGCALHLQHLSCAGSVDALRAARRAGWPVTGEASPHHLMLTAEAIVNDDGNWRMNPPLGNREDRAALRQAILDGTLSILATDHAPHAPETKNKGFARAPFGVIGLENALSASWQALGCESGMPLLDFVARWTLGPARLIGLPAPTLAPRGQPADFTLVDFNATWTVAPEAFASRSRNCPFAGQILPARVLMTVCAGRVTWIDPVWRESSGFQAG